MKTFTLVQILESAKECFNTGLAEAASPRDNESDASRCWFEGAALLTMDSFSWNAVIHNWSNDVLEPEDRLDDDERVAFQEANELHNRLHAELERLWANEDC